MVKRKRQLIGELGEKAAAKYLLDLGFHILDRNWRIKGGEIDLVAKSPAGKVHFVEVKTRSSNSFGHPLEAIDRQKAHRLQKLALAWMVSHNAFGNEYQVDACAITLKDGAPPQIDYRAGVL